MWLHTRSLPALHQLPLLKPKWCLCPLLILVGETLCNQESQNSLYTSTQVGRALSLLRLLPGCQGTIYLSRKSLWHWDLSQIQFIWRSSPYLSTSKKWQCTMYSPKFSCCLLIPFKLLLLSALA